MLLSQQHLDEIADALQSSPVTYDTGTRTLILSNVPREVADGLSVCPSPVLQLQSDLQALNRMCLEDDSRPLVYWLERAARMLARYQQGLVLKGLLEEARKRKLNRALDRSPVAILLRELLNALESLGLPTEELAGRMKVWLGRSLQGTPLTPPPDLNNSLEILVYMGDVPVQADRSLPIYVFAVGIASELLPETQKYRIQALAGAFAQQRGLSIVEIDAMETRFRRPVGRHLLVDIEPRYEKDSAPRYRYTIYEWCLDVAGESNGWTRAAGYAAQIRARKKWESQERLEAGLRSTLGELIRDYAVDPGNLAIEFFLPVPLLTLTIDEWPVCVSTARYPGDIPPESLLGAECAVVVRCEERVPRGGKERVSRSEVERWKARWRCMRKVHEEVRSIVMHCPPRAADRQKVYEYFLRETDIGCLGLLFPPEHGARCVLRNVLDAGLPAALWVRRATTAGDDVERTLRLPVEEEIDQIAHRLRELRLGAAPDWDWPQAGEAVTLLWDNPERTLPDVPGRAVRSTS